MDTFGTAENVVRCPHFGGSFVYKCMHVVGTLDSVLISGVSLFQGCPYRGVPLAVQPSKRIIF